MYFTFQQDYVYTEETIMHTCRDYDKVVLELDLE